MIEHKQRERKTSIPVAILASESVFLYAWCQQDRQELVKAGVDWATVESLPALCEKCQTLYAKSCVEKKELAVHKKRLRKLFRAAIRVRSMIAEKIRDVLEISGSDKKLPVYHRRTKYAEVIQDLHNLVGFGTMLRSELGSIGFKPNRIDAVKKCAELRQRDYLAVYKMGIEVSELRLEFLDSYKTLFTTVQKIRKKALSHFPKSSLRHDGYVSQYHKNRK
jgi:hypothetical protein